MKKLLLIAALSIVGFTTSNAQEKKPAAKNSAPVAVKVSPEKVDGPGIIFENETIDYGTVAHNSDGRRDFVFVNNGNKPLIIVNATGSCGCTVPTKPTEPIMPGASGVIGVKYATEIKGPFNKSVTVTTNASPTPITLTIKGTVVDNDVPRG
ncbi:MAG: DUF1573 domain-containing protein [Flavobacterium sp.]|nr:DUF1573 domain-containing protein [Flavobacterium sp.]